jgi:hypothetical protein
MGPKLVDYLLYEPEDNGVLWIKFNRPERMNALVGTAEENGTVAKIGDMRAGDNDPDIRVIVLTGVGRGFCSGANRACSLLSCNGMAEEVEACRLDPSGPDWFEIYPDPRHLRGRRALILDLWRIPAQRVMAGVGRTRRERADGDVGRDWAGEAADFRAARAARWRTDKAGRPAQ